jgi:shikimate dehydrogenase
MINNDSIIINTTPVGMQNEQCPIESDLLHKNQTLIDVIYTPFETAFLKLGKKIGAKTMNGLDMFIYQALTSMDLWFGEDISKKVNFTQLNTYLKNKLC